MLGIAGVGLAIAVATALVPTATRWIVDGWADPMPMLALAVGVWAAVSIGTRLLESVVGKTGTKIGNSGADSLRCAIDDHLAHVHLGYYEGDRAGLAQTATPNIEGAHRAMATTAPWMIVGAMSTVGAAVGALVVDVRVALLVLAVLPPVALVYRWTTRRLGGISAQYRDALGSMTRHFDHWRHGPGALLARLNHGEEELSREVRRLSSTLGALALRKRRAREVSGVSSIFALTALGVACWLGAASVGVGAGTAVGIWAGLSPLYYETTTLLARRQDLAEDRAKLSDVLALLKEKVERSGGLTPEAATGSIQFDDMAFQYSGRPPVYKRFDLEVPAGTRLAVFGRSGSGKSTLVKLLLAIEEPTAGSIRLDGVSLGELDLDRLRSRIALVPQAPHIVPGWSLRDQIALWDDHPAGKIEAVGATVGLGDLVAELPDGWDTPVTAGTLSGGQIQRIALARALLRNASVFLIDEALRGLPARDHDELEALIGRVTEGRTVIWIAHDLPPAWVDQVVELGQGRVSLQGTPAEVSSSDGQLAELTRRLQDRLDRLAA